MAKCRLGLPRSGWAETSYEQHQPNRLPADRGTVEFVRGRGYVLDLSDTTFSKFFEDDLDVDIDDQTYAANGTSKGKRLRCARSKRYGISAYLLASIGTTDPVHNAEGRYLTIAASWRCARRA